MAILPAVETWSDLDALVTKGAEVPPEGREEFGRGVLAALHRLLNTGSGFDVGVCLDLAKYFDRNRIRIPLGVDWSDFVSQLRGLAKVAPFTAALNGHLILFALTAIESGVAAAIVNLFTTAGATGDSKTIATFLLDGGFCDAAGAALSEATMPDAIGVEPPYDTLVRIQSLRATLLPDQAMPRVWVEAVFQGVVLAALLVCAERGQAELALRLEVMLEPWLKVEETEAHYQDCFRRWVPALQRVGRAFGEALGPLPPRTESGSLRVGFFVHAASMLAHVAALRATLAGLGGPGDRPFEPCVYVFSGTNDDLVSAFAAIGVPVVFIEREAKPGAGIFEKLQWLRHRLAADGVTTLVWLCLQIYMAFSFAMRLAPVQVWWSMKLHPDIGGCDGYIMLVSGFEKSATFWGRTWRTVRFCDPFAFDPRLSEEAGRRRGRVPPAKVQLGTLARQEKLASPTFLEQVCAILVRNPDALWLFTGHVAHPAIHAALEAHGVGDQAEFIGWVDTKLYAQVIDIFVDTSPIACAMTVMEAMSAGKPVLFRRDADGLADYTYRTLRSPSVAEETKTMIRDCFTVDTPLDHLPGGADSADFIALGDRLVRDAAYRQRCGQAARRFAEKVFCDSAEPAQSLARHLIDISGHSAARAPGEG